MPQIRLLSNTGVQFVRLDAIPDSELTAPTIRLASIGDGIATMLQGEVIKPGARAPRRDDDDEDGPARQATSFAPKEIVDRIMKVRTGWSRGGWIPLPMNAGQCAMWAMLWIDRRQTQVEKEKVELDLVLAIDTTTTEGGVGGTLNASLPQHFGVEALQPINFWQSPAIEDYIAELVRLVPDRNATVGRVQAELASLYALVQRRMPDVYIADGQGSPVDVTLVVDFGNSRTCAVLVEHPQRMTQLKLRNLGTRPYAVSDGAFPTQLAFVKPGFSVLTGEVVGIDPARGDGEVRYESVSTFADLSVVRLGDEALGLLEKSSQDVQVCGMSSPKRYMWDREQRSMPWLIAASGSQSDPVKGPLLRLIDHRNPLNLHQVAMQVVNPAGFKHPRLVGTTLVFVELLEHAYRQANEQAHRGDDPETGLSANAGRRRVIRNIVLMHPAGMHSKEVEAFRASVANAARLWSGFRSDPVGFAAGRATPAPPLVPIPNVRIACDEGLAIQTCFIYDEWLTRFVKDTHQLADVYGSPREGKKVIRLASIDVGGGTIDMAIADYAEYDPKAGVNAMTVRKLFHDGISSAGDDIAEHVLAAHVFPAIVRQMGIDQTRWDSLFGTSASASADSGWNRLRRTLVTELWLPLVHSCLARLELDQAVHCKLSELIPMRNATSQRIAEFNQRLASRTETRSVLNVDIHISVEKFVKSIQDVLSKPVSQYCDIIAQYGCDALVLGGRAAASEAVHRLVLGQLPVPPASVLMLNGRRFGDWFPFAGGQVDDAKTCSVVGAAVAFHAAHNMLDLFLKFLPGDDKPIDIIGLYNDKSKALYAVPAVLTPDDGERDVQFQSFHQTVIGARRIDSPKAAARPIFQLSFKKALLTKMQLGLVTNDPVRVTLSRVPQSGDEVDVTAAQGVVHYTENGSDPIPHDINVGDVSCRLQTMLNQDYWLDSGCFRKVENDEDVDHD